MLGEAIIDTNTTIDLENRTGTTGCFVQVSFNSDLTDPANADATTRRVMYSQNILEDGTAVVTINGVPFELVGGRTVSDFWEEMLQDKTDTPQHTAIVLRALQDFLRDGISGVISLKVLDESSRIIDKPTPLSRVLDLKRRTIIYENDLTRKLALIPNGRLFNILPGIKQLREFITNLKPSVLGTDFDPIIAELTGTSGTAIMTFLNEDPIKTHLMELYQVQGGDLNHKFYQGVKIVSAAMNSRTSKCRTCPIGCGRNDRLKVHSSSGLRAAATLIQPDPSVLIALSDAIQEKQVGQ